MENESSQIIAGDALSWSRSLPDYPRVVLGFLADQVVEITEAGIAPAPSDKTDVVALVARG